MVKLPDPTIDKIYATYEAASAAEPQRDYLGGSEIGEECSRRLWYSFRHAGREKIEGRIARLFATGHREEARIVADLRAIGCEVLDVDPSTGKQWRYALIDGHLSGGLDGVVCGLPESPQTWHLLEVKTHNRKSFDVLEKDVVKKSKPKHWAQCQIYMGMAGLTRAFYVAHCKDDDRLYSERIEFEPNAHKALLLKAERIIHAEYAPEKISDNPSFFGCKFCPFSEICHGDAAPKANCRTCVHSAPAADGAWSCAVGGSPPSVCGEHIFIPSMLGWAEPVDGDPTWVRYKIKSTGREFINVASTGFPAIDLCHYSSAELQNCTAQTIGEPMVEAARSILGGKVAEVSDAVPS